MPCLIGPGLAGDAAALDLDQPAETALGPSHPERHAHLGLVEGAFLCSSRAQR